MEITFNTPALLFPAISLLLLAYTNRFLALANLVRRLHDEYKRGEQCFDLSNTKFKEEINIGKIHAGFRCF